MKKKRSISANVLFNLIYQSLTVIMPLIITPYLSRVIGSEGIGINGYTLSIVTYFVLIGSLGTAMYGQREIAKVEDDKEKYTYKFWEILIIRIVFTLVAMIVFYFSFCIKNDYTLYYRIFLLYMIAYSLNISWLFQGLEQFDKIIVRNIIVKLLSIGVIFIFVKNQNDLWKYILIFSLSEFFGNISLWLYLPSRLTKINIKKLKFKYHIIPTIMMFLPQVAIQIYTVLDKTMVGLLTKDMNQVGYYEQAQNIAKAVLVIMASVQVVMNSRVANANAINDKKEIKECLRKSFEFVWLMGIPLMFGLIACSSNIVPWYYGPGFDAVKPLLVSSCPLIVAIGLNGITGIVYLIHTDQQNAFTKSVVIGALTNIVFNFILIKKFSTIGATISSVIAETVIFVLHFRYIKQIYNIRDIFKPCVKPIISGLFMFIIVYFASMHLSPSIMHTVLLTILGATIYVILIYLMKYKMFMDALDMFKKVIKIKK